jgi:hypothetical protein
LIGTTDLDTAEEIEVEVDIVKEQESNELTKESSSDRKIQLKRKHRSGEISPIEIKVGGGSKDTRCVVSKGS